MWGRTWKVRQKSDPNETNNPNKTCGPSKASQPSAGLVSLEVVALLVTQIDCNCNYLKGLSQKQSLGAANTDDDDGRQNGFLQTLLLQK